MMGVRSPDVAETNYLESIRYPEIREALRAALSGTDVTEKQIAMFGPEERQLLIRAKQIHGGGAVAVLHDITKMKRLEQLRSEFVGNVSHELKTPLTSIKAAVDTLLEGAIDDPAHNKLFLEKVNRNAERLSLLIDDLLELTSLENRKTAVNIKEQQLKDLVKRAVEPLEEKAASKKVMIETRLHDPSAKVLCNDEQIVRALINLLDNAVKYNKENGKITVTSSEEDGQY